MLKTMNLIPTQLLRQITEEGWTAEKKQLFVSQSYASAASCYRRAIDANSPVPKDWPWEPTWWEPSADRRTNLSRAAGYCEIAASIASEWKSHEMRDAASEQKEKCEEEIAAIDRSKSRANQGFVIGLFLIFVLFAFFVIEPLQLN